MIQTPLSDLRTAKAALKKMTMAELHALGALASRKTISGAADLLGVTQPAVSQLIRSLEEKLGVALFERSRRGLSPTEHGSNLLHCAQAVRASLDIAAEDLFSTTRGEAPRLRIGCQTAAAAGLLAVAVGRFAALEPGCTAVLIEEHRDILLEKLRNGHIDLFVGRLPSQGPGAGSRSEMLAQEGAVVVCARGHALARRRHVSLKDLLRSDWVLPAEGSAFHVQIVETLSKYGIALPKPRVEARSMVAIAAIVSTSELVSFLPWSLFAANVAASLAALPVKIDWSAAPIGVIRMASSRKDRYVERFLECLRLVAASANSGRVRTRSD